MKQIKYISSTIENKINGHLYTTERKRKKKHDFSLSLGKAVSIETYFELGSGICRRKRKYCLAEIEI
jgi:hypothetical protein